MDIILLLIAEWGVSDRAAAEWGVSHWPTAEWGYNSKVKPALELLLEKLLHDHLLAHIIKVAIAIGLMNSFTKH